MKKFAHPFAIVFLFTLLGSCSTNEPAPVVAPVVFQIIKPGTIAVVPDDGLIHNLTEAKAISTFLRSFYVDKLRYSVDEPVPGFTSEIPGSSGEAITSGSIIVQKNMGVLEEYKVMFETKFNLYADTGFIIDGNVARDEIYSYSIDGNSMSSAALYVRFEREGRSIQDMITISYSFIKATGLSSYTVKNSLNTYAWSEQ